MEQRLLMLRIREIVALSNWGTNVSNISLLHMTPHFPRLRCKGKQMNINDVHSSLLWRLWFPPKWGL